MKRSSKVGLTLLVPAMAAFGCDQQAIPVVGKNQAIDGQAAVDCDIPAKPGEPEKPKCTKQGTTTGHHNSMHHSRGFWYMPFFWGGRSNYSQSMPPRTTAPHITPTASHTGSSTTHTTGTAGHHSGSTTHGGFGGTGSHLSGGT